MNSSSLREASPSKNWRPSTAYKSPNKRTSVLQGLNGSILNYTNDAGEIVTNQGNFTYQGVNIIRELNGKEIVS